MPRLVPWFVTGEVTTVHTQLPLPTVGGAIAFVRIDGCPVVAASNLRRGASVPAANSMVKQGCCCSAAPSHGQRRIPAAQSLNKKHNFAAQPILLLANSTWKQLWLNCNPLRMPVGATTVFDTQRDDLKRLTGQRSYAPA
jgi:hypothetical protein